MAGKRKELNIADEDRWYLVGLITSDGNLSKDGRHIDITSKDRRFLIKLAERINLPNKIAQKRGGFDSKGYRIQFGNINFYNFLLSVGLMPNKSLSLKELNIPEKYFTDFLRGVIDGDGSIRGWLHPTNCAEQWSLRVYSGSKDFLRWLELKAETILKVKGRIYKGEIKKAASVLKYGKLAARTILSHCYYKGSFSLKRKNELAQMCVTSYKGWSKSKNVFLN